MVRTFKSNSSGTFPMNKVVLLAMSHAVFCILGFSYLVAGRLYHSTTFTHFARSPHLLWELGYFIWWSWKGRQSKYYYYYYYYSHCPSWGSQGLQIVRNVRALLTQWSGTLALHSADPKSSASWNNLLLLTLHILRGASPALELNSFWPSPPPLSPCPVWCHPSNYHLMS